VKYEDVSTSDSWDSSAALDDAITASPAVFSRATELNEKSVVASAPLMRENAPLWQASMTTIVSVLGRFRICGRSSASGTSSRPRAIASARACPE
jgi:hypothetical protein